MDETVRDALPEHLKDTDEPRLRAYELRTALFWLVLSLAFLVVLVLEFVGPTEEHVFLAVLDWIIWAAFVVDYFYRLRLAVHKWPFVRSVWNLLDLLIVLLPLLTVVLGAFVGFARVSRVLRIVRVLRIGAILPNVLEQGERFMHRKNTGLVLTMTVGCIVLAWLWVWRAESTAPDSSIQSWFDALWWSIVTALTVGYGGLYPKTVEGRIGGVVLMILGIALFGWVTATLASFFVEKTEENEQAREIHRLHARIDELTDQLGRVETLLADHHRASIAGAAGRREGSADTQADA